LSNNNATSVNPLQRSPVRYGPDGQKKPRLVDTILQKHQGPQNQYEGGQQVQDVQPQYREIRQASGGQVVSSNPAGQVSSQVASAQVASGTQQTAQLPLQARVLTEQEYLQTLQQNQILLEQMQAQQQAQAQQAQQNNHQHTPHETDSSIPGTTTQHEYAQYGGHGELPTITVGVDGKPILPGNIGRVSSGGASGNTTDTTTNAGENTVTVATTATTAMPQMTASFKPPPHSPGGADINDMVSEFYKSQRIYSDEDRVHQEQGTWGGNPEQGVAGNQHAVGQPQVEGVGQQVGQQVGGVPQVGHPDPAIPDANKVIGRTLSGTLITAEQLAGREQVLGNQQGVGQQGGPAPGGGQ
jgi:hypothetical protein